ncbi:DEAD/DEAH box helicase [Desulfobulbus sp. AH-315-M07]|nr:DEAD/DEAH box helicase [Desulfobulbus sp. AH-315-M07]
MARRTKKSTRLTLHDKLSRLTYTQAVKLLGEKGEALIRSGGRFDIDPNEQVRFTPKRFTVDLGDASVTIRLDDGARQRLRCRCRRCTQACEHVGAALSLVLEEKMALGLSVPPSERVPLEHLTSAKLVERALSDRAARARQEKMNLRSIDPEQLWTDYTITSATSGKTHRLALRGWERGESYCSCPDFRKNTLGTCKHLLHALGKLRRRWPAAARSQPYVRKGVSIALRYGEDVTLVVRAPERFDPAARRLLKPLLDRPVDDVPDLVRRVRRLAARGHDVVIYPDAEEHIDRVLFAEHMAREVAAIRKSPGRHPLRTELLRTQLLPFQLDGIAFAVGAGRAVLADDMGLGKTIQGIGVAELLARDARIGRVLIVCPTSLKSQWRSEIQRFSYRSCQLVLGRADERFEQYDSGAFFTVCNYEQVLRDVLAIEQVRWDLIILDEAQRIKNWEAKTSRLIKALRSRYALALTGTPLENRLEELYSVVSFIDDRRLGPAFRFLHRHRVVDERGRVQGYKNLAELREKLAPVLLRRTRGQVLRQLPERTDDIVRITPTDEQLELHDSHMRIVGRIVKKAYLTEMDLLRLRKALLMCRMAADSTFLVDKQGPGYSSKLEELARLIERLAAERGRKVVLFSEWTTMLGLIEPILQGQKIDYVRLDGSVPQKKRQALVHRFQNDDSCTFFITTNAGSTGLNLQAADTIINVDLPWNPAVLEQRIARAHRMGQKRPVHVFVLVTEGTIEDKLLGTLAAKRDLALAALDHESTVDAVDMDSGAEELRRRLEVLLGAAPDAPVDESEKRSLEAEVVERARSKRVASAAGELLRAAFALAGELLPNTPEAVAPRQLTDLLSQSSVDQLVRDENGQIKLTLTLPDLAGLGSLVPPPSGS